jgi:hypothetical protein
VSRYLVPVFSNCELVSVTLARELPISLIDDFRLVAACPISLTAKPSCSCAALGDITARSSVSSFLLKSALISVRRLLSRTVRSLDHLHPWQCDSTFSRASAMCSSALETISGSLYLAICRSVLDNVSVSHGLLSASSPFASRNFLASLSLADCLACDEVSLELLVFGLWASTVFCEGCGCAARGGRWTLSECLPLREAF